MNINSSGDIKLYILWIFGLPLISELSNLHASSDINATIFKMVSSISPHILSVTDNLERFISYICKERPDGFIGFKLLHCAEYIIQHQNQ